MVSMLVREEASREVHKVIVQGTQEALSLDATLDEERLSRRGAEDVGIACAA